MTTREKLEAVGAAHAVHPGELPPHLLRAAYFIGKVPFRACRSEPRVSYTLYVPDQYCEIHSAFQQRDLIDLPNRLPLVVNIHGTRRDAVTCRDSLIAFADEQGVAILAPLFPNALETTFDLDKYNQLRSATLQGDLVLLDILNEVQHLWPGICTDPIVLLGFSGGAQFVHRFMYLYPERLAGVGIAAPGRTTVLGSDEAWPDGTGNIGDVFADMEVDIPGIQQIPDICIFVGGRDDGEAQRGTQELRAWMQERSRGMVTGMSWSLPLQRGRMQAAEELQRNLLENGVECDLKVVPGVAHEYLGLVPAILEWLEQTPAIVDPSP